MPVQFDDAVGSADSGMKSAIRAQQAWQYLIARASNRQISRYEELRELMGYPTSNPLGVILGCIMYYCEQHALPPLTIIVVNKEGIPGEGFTAEKLKNYHKRREDVFNFPWYKFMPPTAEELRQAFVLGQ